MLENLVDLLPGLGAALGQTLAMLGIGVCAAIVFGGPLGIVLFIVGAGPAPLHPLARLLGWTVDMIRSIPFLILLVALLPLTRLVAGSSIGPLAASVPLSIAAVPYFARLVEQTLRDVPHGVVDAARAMGASKLQVVVHVLLVEARSGLVLALTVFATAFLSYATVAGAVGGGGLGALAFHGGYERFETDIMVFTVAVLVALVQVMQLTGARLARRLDHG
jgi:D-methionine transport system permease protein